MDRLCLNCGQILVSSRTDYYFLSDKCTECSVCRSIFHSELRNLAIAHVDCDAFYASVEKRDNPDLLGKPVIVGGGHRGVVAACCYVSRISGVRSAMPMFEALRLCPEAVVIKPNIDKYKAIGRQIQDLMYSITPIVEIVSIDEAFLDLTGTINLHKGFPAQTLIKLRKRIEKEVGITVSIGLSYAKFLAKIGSDLDKPRGFSIIGRSEALSFLKGKSVKILWGVGTILCEKLNKDGIETVGALRCVDENLLIERYGKIGKRLHLFSRGIDESIVQSETISKSMSAEQTFPIDLNCREDLEKQLWLLSEKVSKRLKTKGLGCKLVTLKMKQSNFILVSRSRRRSNSIQMAEEIYDFALRMLDEFIGNQSFRLLGINAKDLVVAADRSAKELLDPIYKNQRNVEIVIDDVRKKFGDNSITKGRGFFKK